MIPGSLVKRERNIRKWTQGHLGALLGEKYYWISRIENSGEVEGHDVERLDKAFGGTQWRDNVESLETLRRDIELLREELAALKKLTFSQGKKFFGESGLMLPQTKSGTKTVSQKEPKPKIR